MGTPTRPTREDIEKFSPNQRTTRALENLFDTVSRSTQDGSITVETAYNNAAQAQAFANRNLGLILSRTSETVIATATAITTGSQNLICDNAAPIVIILNPRPALGEVVSIKRRGALVTVIAPSIEGDSELIIHVQGDAPKLMFNGTEWGLV